MTILFQRVPDNTTPAQKREILAFFTDHLTHCGMLPMSISLPDAQDPEQDIELDYDQCLSALSADELSALSQLYTQRELDKTTSLDTTNLL